MTDAEIDNIWLEAFKASSDDGRVRQRFAELCYQKGAAEAELSRPVMWQPIETAPRDGTRVLLVNEEGAIDVAGYVEQWTERDEFVRKAKDWDVYRTVREECGYWNTAIAHCPTHWMPLPPPPQSA